MINSKLAFIGTGNMASAVLRGVIANSVSPAQVYASNRTFEKVQQLADETGIHACSSNRDAARQADVVVLGVKPQQLADVCADLLQEDLSGKLFVSLAAGVKASAIADFLEGKAPVIRAMPNTPSLIGCGAIGLSATADANEEQKQLASELFSSVGISVWVENDAQMDVVTGLAGSGPAYYFAIMQSFIDAAEQAGLESRAARQLGVQTALGAAKLAQHRNDTPLSQLREEVTSPGGTTAAALARMAELQLDSVLKSGVDAAINRGRELAEQNQKSR